MKKETFLWFCLVMVLILIAIVVSFSFWLKGQAIQLNTEAATVSFAVTIIEAETEEAPEEEAPEEEVELKSSVFTVYAYCPCKKCCGKSKSNKAYGITKTGTIATEGRTIAVDPSVIPLGSTVYFNDHEYTAEDTGTGIDGYTIDLFFNAHKDAVNWGVKELLVEWREEE